MSPRKQRMMLVALVVIGVAGATAFTLLAFQENLLYFYTPTQVADGEAPGERMFRIGGLVIPGSIDREPGSLEVRFVVTDTAHEIAISYAGILPDLFREGQGVIAHGHLDSNGVFVANEVLAKHDENYMPPEVAEAIQQAGHPTEGG